MKGTYPAPVYIVITVLGTALLVLNSAMDLPIAVGAVGAGVFAYGLCRLIGEWRIKNRPEYAKELEISNQDERMAFIADKSRSATLIITVIVLSVLGIILLSIGQKAYGYTCLYATCGISAIYFIVYQIISRRY